MISVLVPVILLLLIILIKKIPYIGGNISAALVICGLSAFLLGGVYNPITWIIGWIDGIDKISWVLALILFGSIYAETQVELGTMETVLESMRARFGHSPKGLVSAVIISLAIAGSLLGDAIASATVVGVLIIKALHELKMTGEQISATIVMGACLGSIMPPITQALFMSSSLIGLKSPDPAVNIGYFTVGLGTVLVCIYASKIFIKINSLPEDLIPNKSATEILIEGWKTLVPLCVLIVIIVLRSGFKIEILDVLDPIFSPIRNLPIIKGIDFAIVKAILVSTVISFFFNKVRKNGLEIIKRGIINIKMSFTILIFAGLMIGAFYNAGQIAVVQNFAQQLSPNVLKVGGAGAMVLIGMLTGSQTTTQTSIFTFFGPALVASGVNPVYAAVAGAHLAMAGQGLPPADLTTFVVSGLVGGILGIKVDPIRSMIYSMFMCIYFLIIGFIFMYI
ncbi:MAG TPA: TRAP transporter large permease subunit [Tepidanaerobacter syntrophicus]|uniref:TRAP transporter large permease subunit n=1 Tax=Tepidanaerobacter syntrophicus TaxID=224999 RepID=UPI0017518B13|nr:TRAP transporter large permease subunit [Tepidanaerobacter syntrophicus]HHV83927.1 TRAP transporter large permease subunit [Tepidanaerobacter syntrophicus]